jgi:hypothetical protein
MATQKKSAFDTLYAINVKNKIEKKGNLDYLPWATAWAEVKKVYPNVTYKVYKNDTYGINYHHDGRTAWVEVGVTINDLEHINSLPIMDYRNNAIPLEKVTSMDVNKAIQRSFTKAIAMHGLGLTIYNGEELEAEVVAIVEEKPKKGSKLSISTAKWNKMKAYAKQNKDNRDVVFDAIAMQSIELTPYMKDELTKILG